LGGIQSAGSALADAAGSAASWVGNAASVAAGWVKAGAQALLAAGRFLVVKTAQLAVAAATKAWTAAQWLFNAAMDANPITLIIIALIALAAGFAYLWTHSAAFRDFWIDTWHVIEDAAKAVWHFLQRAFSDISQWISDAWNAIKSATQTVWRWFADFVRVQVQIVQAIIGWFASLPGKFHEWFDEAKQAIIQKATEAVTWLTGLPGRFLNALGDVGSVLFKAGKSILDGLLNGLKSAWNDVSGWVSQVGGWISNLKGPIEVDAVLLTPHGSAIMQGLLEGIQSQMPALEAQLGHVTATVRASVAPAIPATSTVGAHGAGGTVVNINVTGNHVLSDRDLDPLIDRMGRAIATRILPQGGLRVAM
jgi:phage-related protein